MIYANGIVYRFIIHPSRLFAVKTTLLWHYQSVMQPYGRKAVKRACFLGACGVCDSRLA
ncbi:MAG: hypothetical protein J6X30_05275 [Clostridia bacterium]|nr:hypothetical protein [Clostridia bacterium]